MSAMNRIIPTGKRVAGVALFLVLLLLASCSPRIIETVRVEKVTEYRDTTVWRDTTVFVPIPLGRDQAITSTRDTSRLETQVATSTAYVDSTGLLHHSLENKQTALPYTAKIPSKTIWVSTSVTSAQILTKTVEVDKPLSWWQKFRIGAFWWLLGAVVLLLLWTFRKLIFQEIM